MMSFLSLALLVVQDPEIDAEPKDPAWHGSTQCVANWENPGDDRLGIAISTSRDSTNVDITFRALRQADDPALLAVNETRTLEPRTATLGIDALGSGSIEVTSIAVDKDLVWHMFTLGHYETLDKLPDNFTLTLTIGKAPPLRIGLRDVNAARDYLKFCTRQDTGP